MPDQPAHAFVLDPAVVAQLACPACHGDLHVDSRPEEARLICAGCSRAYPIIDGIPALIVDRAEKAG